MTLRLHMGVYEVPYAEGPQQEPVRKPRKAKHRRHPKKAARTRKSGGTKVSTITTGDVAEILEAEYHLMGLFFEHHEQEIADRAAQDMAGALENLVAGAPPNMNMLATTAGFVASKFKEAIETKEFDEYGIEGVPTKAAQLRGEGRQRSSRFKNKKPASDASFYDTGLYEDSATAWIERT